MTISLITINFNNFSGLKKTVQSVLSQNIKDFEYLVIDAASTDGSKEYLESLKNNFAYMVSEKDSGIYDAMNKGIAKAQGEYLLFLNSGDYLFEPNTLEKLKSRLHTYDIVYGNMKIEVNGLLKNGFMPSQITTQHMVQDTLWHPVSFIKKDLFLKYDFYNTEYKICADYDFFFKTIINKKASTYHVKQFISVFNMDGMSSDPANAIKIQSEREKIRRSYLSLEEIERFKGKKGNFLLKLKNWLK